MVRNDIKNLSLLKTKFLIYAFNGRTLFFPQELSDIFVLLPFYLISSLGDTPSKSATLKMVARLGCLRLHT